MVFLAAPDRYKTNNLWHGLNVFIIKHVIYLALHYYERTRG